MNNDANTAPAATIHAAAGVSLRVSITAATSEEIRALAAQLPKSIRLQVQGNWAGLYVQLWADESNGGKNESGLRRVRSLRKNLAKLGITLEVTRPYDNAMTATELEALVG